MDLDDFRRLQHDVITRAQAHACGLSDDAIIWRLERGRWRRVHPGVYLAHSGALTWWSEAAAAVLHAGRASALGMLGAGHAHGFVDRPPPGLVVMVPHGRSAQEDRPRLRIRRRRGPLATVNVRGIPVTSPEETVLDLGGIRGATRTEAISHAARAVQRKTTTPERIAAALARRTRHPHRAALALALGDIDEGAESVLEVDFHRGVLRRHGLPPFRMQVPAESRGRSVRRDFAQDASKVIVEVDGLLGHVGAGMHVDRRRDRAAARDGWLTLRCGWVDVRHDRCELATDIALALRSRGWRGKATRCGQACAVPRDPGPDDWAGTPG